MAPSPPDLGDVYAKSRSAFEEDQVIIFDPTFCTQAAIFQNDFKANTVDIVLCSTLLDFAATI